MDNFITGSHSNVSHLVNHPHFQLIEWDITKYIRVEQPLDYILHFACPASPADYLKYPIQTLKAGALGTHNALGLAKSKGACFLLASTSEVYGDPLVHPQSETYRGNVDPTGYRGVYDESKRFAEAMTMAYHRYHAVDTRIVRIFNTFGPRMRLNDGRVLPTFMRQALLGDPVTVHGAGDQTRSFQYTDDTVEGIYRLLISDITEPVNIGNPDEISILDVAREIIALAGSASKIVFEPMPADSPKVRQPDITLAQSLLNWEPSISRKEGLRRTIGHARKHLECLRDNVN